MMPSNPNKSSRLRTPCHHREVNGPQRNLAFPEIGREGLVLSNVSFEPPKVHFELREFETVFDGVLEGDTIIGDFVDPDGAGLFSLKR